MQQRQLRLGDILDDYCPREHRLTDHAVVAMIGSEIKQVRCGTCEAEHPYKGAKVPAHRKRKNATAAAYERVLAAVSKKELDLPGALVPALPSEDGRAASAGDRISEEIEATAESSAESLTRAAAPEDGPAHRPLIRATLPRTETQTTPRPVPEFTMRQTGRHKKFTTQRTSGPHPKGRGQGGPGPHRASGRPSGMHGLRPGHPAHRSGPRPGPHHSRQVPGGPARSGKKRPR